MPKRKKCVQSVFKVWADDGTAECTQATDTM